MAELNYPKRFRYILLIDSVGAAFTAGALACMLLPFFRTYFHMPKELLIVLCIAAVIMSCTAMAFHFLVKMLFPRKLKLMAILNFSYCLVTVFLLAKYAMVLFPLDFTYFIVEIALVSALASLEWRLSAVMAKN